MHFGEIAVKEGMLTSAQIAEALEAQQDQSDWKIGEILVFLGHLQERQVERILKIQRREKKTCVISKGVESMAGKSFGEYRVCRILGRGAMGVVYLAKDREGREVALKLILDKTVSVVQREYTRQRFFSREARLARQLDHPHIVRAFASGEIDGTLYLSSEVISGGSLADVLNGSVKLSPQEALCIAYQMLSALAEIDRHRLIHRDVKPSNILIDENGVGKLSDFGLARPTASNRTKFTKTGDAMGTPYYMAPEQVRGNSELDIRCDLYALGATIYHCLCGVPPYQDNSIALILRHHLQKPIPEMAGIDSEIAALIGQLLAKEAGQRPQNPTQVLQRIESLLAGNEDLAEDDFPAFCRATLRQMLHRITALSPCQTDLTKGMEQARLTFAEKGKEYVLFVYAGENLDFGRSTRSQSQHVCLRSGQIADDNKAMQISREHFTLSLRDHDAYITDKGSKKGTVCDGEKLQPGIDYPLTSAHIIDVANVIKLRLQLVHPQCAYRIAAVGNTKKKTPAVFVERVSNGKEYSYALIPGQLRLGFSSKSALQPDSRGSFEIIRAGGVLWLSRGDLPPGECRMLSDGMVVLVNKRQIRVNTIVADEQK